MRALTIITLLAAVSARAAAQSRPATIAPGMSQAQVVAALGQPATARTASEFTYLFYHNDCGKRCGMNDLVVIRGDSVVDAIFRSPARHYSGTSSSPTPVSQVDAARKRPSAASNMPTPVRAPSGSMPGVADSTRPRRKPPGEASDIRPSIPLHPPAVKPSPSSPSTKVP